MAAPATAAKRFGRGAVAAQLIARSRMDLALVFRSPAFLVLLVLGLLNTGGGLLLMDGIYGVAIYPVTRLAITTLEGSFTFIPLIVAIYYAGELVWRERDRKTEEIIDATPTPDWTFVAPKILAIVLVFVAMLTSSIGLAYVVQLFKHFEPGDSWKYLAWYLAPVTVSLSVFAVLAVFVQAVSPHKLVGWGLMVLFIIAETTIGNLGFEHNLYRYGGGPIGPVAPLAGGSEPIGAASRWSSQCWPTASGGAEPKPGCGPG